MKNLRAGIAIFFVIGLSLLPPIDFYITNFSNGYWTWMVCIAGFLGCLTIFLDTNIFVKIIAVAGYINCFFSVSPYISFTSYISLVGCCYLYIFCSTIKNWNLVFKMLQAVAVFNLILITLQFFNHDQLLNFGGWNQEFGGIGQHMRMGSFSVILTSLLVFVNPWWCLFAVIVGVFCKCTWALFSVGAGTFFINKKVGILFLALGVIFVVHFGKIGQFVAKTDRMPVWEKTIELGNKRPFWGVGIGTYKFVFAPLAHLSETVWKTAHNDWLEIFFETGYPGLIFSLILFGYLLFSLWEAKDWTCIAGFMMITTNMMMHFPFRMMNTVPLIVLFLALCEQRIKHGHNIFKNDAC